MLLLSAVLTRQIFASQSIFHITCSNMYKLHFLLTFNFLTESSSALSQLANLDFWQESLCVLKILKIGHCCYFRPKNYEQNRKKTQDLQKQQWCSKRRRNSFLSYFLLFLVRCYIFVIIWPRCMKILLILRLMKTVEIIGHWKKLYLKVSQGTARGARMNFSLNLGKN